MTADERIEQLLKRAGCPMMVVHTTEPTKVSLPVDELADTIDRLEAALENALNERDALLEEVSGMCHACKHIVCGMATDECKMTGEFQCTFEWRGVPDKED